MPKKSKQPKIDPYIGDMLHDGAIHQDISMLRDHLSAYVANVSDHPVIIEKYARPWAVIVSYDEYKKRFEKKGKGHVTIELSELERDKRIQKLKKTPVKDWKWEDIKAVNNKKYGKIDIEKLKKQAWQSILTY